MSRRGSRAPGFAVLSILLALLVPARAIALCCLDGQAGTAGAGAAHGPTSHYGHDVMGDGGNAFATTAPASDCGEPANGVPLLRERSRSDGAPAEEHAALPAARVLGVYVALTETSAHPEPAAAWSGRSRVSFPLRL